MLIKYVASPEILAVPSNDCPQMVLTVVNLVADNTFF